jgi:hypothetical protein
MGARRMGGGGDWQGSGVGEAERWELGTRGV